jgi:transketolase
MIKKDQQLHPDIFAEEPPVDYTRNGYGEGLVEAARENENIVAVCADLAGSTRTQFFKDEFPDRYVEVGVAEQNMATVASGLAAMGKIPFISSYAAFSPGRTTNKYEPLFR